MKKPIPEHAGQRWLFQGAEPMAGLHLLVHSGDWHDAGPGAWSHPTWSRGSLLHQHPFQIQLQICTTSGAVFTAHGATAVLPSPLGLTTHQAAAKASSTLAR